MISILLPSRGRPDNIVRLANSIFETASNPSEIEIIVRLDEDDPKLEQYMDNPPKQTTYFTGPRVVLSELWNECYKRSTGDILMHAGDDIVFRTKEWDRILQEKFNEFEDNIVFVFGDDGSPHNGTFGTHGFIHRKWVETVGYFVPPYFSSDYNDTWLNEVAQKINRHVHIPILTEHMHPDFNKGPVDKTHKDRYERHKKDNVKQIYEDRHEDRLSDADKLRRVMI